MGHEILASPFTFQVKKRVTISQLCEPMILNMKDITKLRTLVQRQYRVHLQFDDLPVIMRLKTSSIDYAVTGYPIGFRAPPEYSGLKTVESFLYNHLKFKILYREKPDEFSGIRIVGFQVIPGSYKHEFDKAGDLVVPKAISNHPDTNLVLAPEKDKKELKVAYTYEVEWEITDMYWSDRWDIYLAGNPDEDVHLYAVMNSLMISLFMTAIVVTVMLRTLKKEINSYNSSIGLLEDDFEDPNSADNGWKLVHGDVFRTPTGFSSLFLSIAVGTGTQIATTMLLMIVFMALQLTNPLDKSRLLTSIIMLFVFSSSASGYMSARIYKLCGGKDWKMNTLYTAAAFPGFLVCAFMMLNICLGIVDAASSVSFLTILSVFLLWVCVSTPLAFVGSYLGFRQEKISIPTRVNQIARVIPTLDETNSTGWSRLSVAPISYLVSGSLPFGSICIEMFFVMNAIWLKQVYYMAGIFACVLFVMVITTAQVSVVLCYLQLCVEDHRWWLRSFFNGASTGMYLFAYAIWFLVTKLNLVGALTVVVYLTYMFMISTTVALFLGSIGFLSCLWFNKSIYGALKVD